MTFDEINISVHDRRFTGYQKYIGKLIKETNEDEMVATAMLLGATFVSTSHVSGENWTIARFEGRDLTFTERFTRHRSAIAFLVCAGVLKPDEDAK